MRHRCGWRFLHLLMCVGSVVSVIAPAAAADDLADEIFDFDSGLYISGTFGHALDFDITSDDVFASSEEFEFSLDETTTVTAAFGAVLGQARGEFEVGFFETDFDQLNFPGGSFAVGGDVSYLTFMGNVFYDIPTPIRGIDLYLGAGLGLAVIDAEGPFEGSIDTVDGLGNVIETFAEIDESFVTFTYQFMGGVSIEILDNVTVFSGYRLRLFSETTVDADGGGSTLNFREHEVNIFEIGLRVEF
ncbi:MAG: hypothetical protein AAGG38_08910 [Planctomycetota bacterium]